ncbi:hypothetical protein [Neobacillus sp. 114]|uniref:hypothetical protein n=1 Tax=Neobacillus sp. 114 TaxID=3048535 RepID=UPI0024C3B90E|nr:hypothetical protein [Neobacillus sp. 114]
MAQDILDLDKLIPEQRIVRLSGKEIDVSKIPSRVTLEIAKKSDVLKSGSEESFPLLLELIVKICKPSQPDITSEWIIDNTSLDQLMALIEFILKPIKDRASGNGKNEVSPSP